MGQSVTLKEKMKMETKFNFNSQVCSNIEQSRRLLALGLKKETADMVYRSYGYIIDEFGNKERRFKQPTLVVDDWESKYDIPAWSLHRLIEMMPNCIPNQGWLSLGHQGLHYSKGYGVADDGLYESIIRMYEWLIKEGYFNKEYLV